jgi:cytoskeleton protein RodZ
VNQDVVTTARQDTPSLAEAGDDAALAAPTSTDAAAISAAPGERLKAARVGMGMSVSDVARHLKLQPRQVEALERGDHQRLPGEVFVRGFTRNYARLVGLDAETLAGVAAQPPAAGTGTAEAGRGRAAVWTSGTQGPVFEEGAARARKSWWPVTFGLIVVAALLLYLGRERLYPDAPAEAPTLSTDDLADDAEADALPGADAGEAESGAPVDLAVVPAPPSDRGQAEVAAADAAVSAPGPVANPVTSPGPQEGAARSSAGEPVPGRASGDAVVAGRSGDAAAVADPALRLVFTQDSWVEVRDGAGAVVFSQLVTAGSERVVRGQPPLRLTVGNASGVRVSFRSRDVDLAPHTQSEVAHVTLE